MTITLEIEIGPKGEPEAVRLVADRYNSYFRLNLVPDGDGQPCLRLRDILKYHRMGQRLDQ